MQLAAIVYEHGESLRVDELLTGLATSLRAQGWKLAGAIQSNEAARGRAQAAMVLEDLASGQRLDVSGLDPAPKACRMDSYALENVVGLVAGSIAPGLDLVVVNRFGKQEAARAGFRPVIEAALVNGVPVLTAVNAANRTHWENFTSGTSVYLPCEAGAIETWARSTGGAAASRRP